MLNTSKKYPTFENIIVQQSKSAENANNSVGDKIYAISPPQLEPAPAVQP